MGTQTITVEVADTPALLRRGLMHRHTLPEQSGMLFVFEQADHYCFWMKDTPIPLSIAFIDAQSRIVSIQSMRALDLTPHCAPEPVTRALEMNAHWFARHGVAVGATVHTIAPPPPAR